MGRVWGCLILAVAYLVVAWVASWVYERSDGDGGASGGCFLIAGILGILFLLFAAFNLVLYLVGADV